MIVDASAMIELLLGTAHAEAVEAILRQATEGLDAPHLIDVELASVSRRLVYRGEVREDRAGPALATLAQFPMRRHPHAHLLPRVWQLRHNMSAYDAVYVALAEVLGVTLVTRDARLGKAAGGLVEVRMV